MLVVVVSQRFPLVSKFKQAASRLLCFCLCKLPMIHLSQLYQGDVISIRMMMTKRHRGSLSKVQPANINLLVRSKLSLSLSLLSIKRRSSVIIFYQSPGARRSIESLSSSSNPKIDWSLANLAGYYLFISKWKFLKRPIRRRTMWTSEWNLCSLLLWSALWRERKRKKNEK